MALKDLGSAFDAEPALKHLDLHGIEHYVLLIPANSVDSDGRVREEEFAKGFLLVHPDAVHDALDRLARHGFIDRLVGGSITLAVK